MGQRLTHKELMKKIESVPSVAENRKSLHYKMGMAVLQKRLELNLTQEQLVERIKAKGGSITQATISKVESAETDVKAATYEKLIEVLGITVEIIDNTKTVATKSLQMDEYQKAINSIMQGINVVNSYPNPAENIQKSLSELQKIMRSIQKANEVISPVPRSPKSYKGDYNQELKKLELSR